MSSEQPTPPTYNTEMAAWKREAELEPTSKDCTGAPCFELWKRKQLINPSSFDTIEMHAVESPSKRDEEAKTEEDTPKKFILWRREAEADAETEEDTPEKFILWKREADAEPEPGVQAR